jgi:hypothetical protein
MADLFTRLSRRFETRTQRAERRLAEADAWARSIAHLPLEMQVDIGLARAQAALAASKKK